MIRFYQTAGAQTGRIIETDRDTVRIGRRPECDVALDPNADLDASGFHAEVRRQGTVWAVVDLGSRNGTFLNGARVEAAVLSSGDEIELGRGGPRLRVELHDRIRADDSMGLARHDAVTGEASPVGLPTPPPPADGLVGDAPTLIAPTTPPPGPTPVSSPGSPTFEERPPFATPPHPVVPALAPAEPRYGRRTVGLMIAAALASRQAGSADPAHARRLAMALGCVSLLLILTIVALVAVFLSWKQSLSGPRHESVILLSKLVSLPSGDHARSTPLLARLHSLDAVLSREQRAVGARVFARAEPALFALGTTTHGGLVQARCTAFAVHPHLLATSAACVLALERRRARGDDVVVVPAAGTGAAKPVRGMWRHPAYDPGGPGPGADVGLVRLEAAVPACVPIAPMASLERLAPGELIFVVGFGGRVGDAPGRTSMWTGVAGNLASLGHEGAEGSADAAFANGAAAPAMARGAPVLDARGHVLGVESGPIVVADADPSGAADAGASPRWAVRSDVLLGLLAGLHP